MALEKNRVRYNKMSCGVPPEIPNAYYNELNFTFAQPVNYKCFDGFQMMHGNQKLDKWTIYCQRNGLWSLRRSIHCQKIICPDISPIDSLHKIQYSNSERTVGSSVSIICKTGNEVTRVCLPTGQWTTEPLICHSTTIQHHSTTDPPSTTIQHHSTTDPPSTTIQHHPTTDPPSHTRIHAAKPNPATIVIIVILIGAALVLFVIWILKS